MNPTSMVLRWYRQSTGQASTRPQYTAEEVLQLLRPSQTPNDGTPVRPDEDQAARVDAVRQAAARPSAWLGELTKQHRQEIGALADRLPSLLFHHTTGGDTAELLRRFGGWSSWRYDRALEVAGLCIASHLNGTPTL